MEIGEHEKRKTLQRYAAAARGSSFTPYGFWMKENYLKFQSPGLKICLYLKCCFLLLRKLSSQHIAVCSVNEKDADGNRERIQPRWRSEDCQSPVIVILFLHIVLRLLLVICLFSSNMIKTQWQSNWVVVSTQMQESQKKTRRVRIAQSLNSVIFVPHWPTVIALSESLFHFN